MKPFKRTPFLLIGVCLFANCKQKDVIIIASFPIERFIEYSVYEPYDIIDPVQIAVSNNYLFLMGIKSDPIFQQYEIQNLEYIQSFGKRGRGPGEFASAYQMYVTRDQEKLYLYNYARKTFSAYLILEHGDLLPEQDLIVDKNMLYNQFHIIKDSLLIYNLVPEVGVVKIDLLSNEHSTKIEFTKNKQYRGEDFFHPDNGVLSVTNQYIVFAYIYRKQIDIYNIDDLSLKARLLAKGHRETMTTSEQSKRYYCNVYATENFIYACYIDPDSDDKQNKYFVEVFDFNGTPVKRYNTDIFLYGLLAVSPDDSAMYSYNWDLGKILKLQMAI